MPTTIADTRLRMSNGKLPDIGEIVASYPLMGNWTAWIGKKPNGFFAIDIHAPHPKMEGRRGWFSIVMTPDLPLKNALKLNAQLWVAEEEREDCSSSKCKTGHL